MYPDAMPRRSRKADSSGATAPADADAEVRSLVGSLLADASAPIALQKALAALNPRELVAVNLFRTGEAKTKADACRAAGYSESIAKRPTSVFTRPKVRAVLALDEMAREPASTVDATSFLADLVELAHADPMDAIGEDGRVRNPAEWPKPLRRMAKRIKFNALGAVEEVTFESRSSIQSMVGKHRDVRAFDSTRVEKRVYVVRDYTGERGPDGNRLASSAPGAPGSRLDPLEGARVVDAERIDGSGLLAEGVGMASGPADSAPGEQTGPARPGGEGGGAAISRPPVGGGGADPAPLRTADVEELESIDRGHIPVPRKS